MIAALSSRLAVAQRRILSRDALTSDTALLAAIALASFIAHLLVAGNYGYFRDELYYMDAGRHLQAGYVDFPPFIAWLAALLEIFGDNLIALHTTTALAGACLIFLTGLMARELGGNRYAQGLAALGTAVALTFVATAGLYTMDVFDELWWALAAYTFIRLVKRDEPRLWLIFGLIAGIGLFTKLSMLFFGFGLVVGLLLTAQRRYFRTRWPWLGGAIALVFLVPYIAWQIPNGWPTIEFWGHYGGIESGSSPLDFLLSQLFTLNPLNLPLSIAGLVFYFRAPEGKPYRALGWAYVVLYALFTLTHAKSYFLAPAYPMLFAAGAVQLTGETRLRRPARRERPRLRALYAAGATTRHLWSGVWLDRPADRREAAGGPHTAAADPFRPLRLAGTGGGRRQRLRRAVRRRARAGLHPHWQLRRGGRPQLLRPCTSPAAGHQRAQHVLLLGLRQLYRADDHSAGVFAAGAGDGLRPGDPERDDQVC